MIRFGLFLLCLWGGGEEAPVVQSVSVRYLYGVGGRLMLGAQGRLEQE